MRYEYKKTGRLEAGLPLEGGMKKMILMYRRRVSH